MLLSPWVAGIYMHGDFDKSASVLKGLIHRVQISYSSNRPCYWPSIVLTMFLQDFHVIPPDYVPQTGEELPIKPIIVSCGMDKTVRIWQFPGTHSLQSSCKVCVQKIDSCNLIAYGRRTSSEDVCAPYG